ncbi:glycine-rich domain-containing protein [Candidatus Bealeia paramacronuclearis]
MSISLEEAKIIINNLDLTHVMNRVRKEKHWSPRMVQVATQFYKNFLILCKKHEDIHLSPSLQIDEIWHAHILYTQDYYEMSEKVFGSYLHHQPIHEEESQESGAENGIQLLQRLHGEEFGAPIYDAVYSFQDLKFAFLNFTINRVIKPFSKVLNGAMGNSTRYPT